MTAASTPPLHVLRGILRLIKSSPSAKPASASAAPSAAASAVQSSATDPTNISLQQHIMSQYRQNQSLPPGKAKIQRKIAYDYFILKGDLTERARLHDLDQGADEKLSGKELSRRAAARAGLQLPKMDD